jgi:glycosyltransferase involved in cell wall biosynthesis
VKTEGNIDGLVLMYVGNLERYQGIDLLLESFALAVTQLDIIQLVIIGGEAPDIEKYRVKSKRLGIESRTHFLGPKPVEQLAEHLAQADILVSPRTKGENTPMKIYPYLHSGKPVLATNLPTHSQILDRSVAMLAEASPKAFSEALVGLAKDENLRKSLGVAGKRLAEEQFSYTAFREKLNAFFDWLEVELKHERKTGTAGI